MNRSEFADTSQTDERDGRLLTAFHIRQNVRASRQQHGVGGILREPCSRLLDGARRAVTEVRQAHHGLIPAVASMPASALRPDERDGWFDACPSPPSHGGAT